MVVGVFRARCGFRDDAAVLREIADAVRRREVSARDLPQAVDAKKPLALAPGESYTHVHRTIHLEGDRAALDGVARRVLGVGLDAIESALPGAGDP